MRALLWTVCILIQITSCTKKPKADAAPEQPSQASPMPLDSMHRPGILVPDAKTGEVRDVYHPSEKELLRLKDLEAKLNLYDKARKDLRPGKDLFARYCASCHGPEGRGGGPAADSLDVAPTNFHEWPIKYGARPQDIALTITQGRNNVMPAFGTAFTDQQLWSLTALVSSWIQARPDAAQVQ